MFHVSSFDCKINDLSQGSSLFSTILPEQQNFIAALAHDTARVARVAARFSLEIVGFGCVWREIGVLFCSWSPTYEKKSRAGLGSHQRSTSVRLGYAAMMLEDKVPPTAP